MERFGVGESWGEEEGLEEVAWLVGAARSILGAFGAVAGVRALGVRGGEGR